MSSRHVSVRSHSRLKVTLARFTILIAIFVISGKGRAQNHVPPGDITEASNQKLTVFDGNNQPVKKGSIKRQDGAILANLDDDGQFDVTACTVTPPQDPPSPGLFRYAKSPSLRMLNSNGAILLPATLFRRSSFSASPQLRTAAYVDEKTETSQQPFVNGKQIKPQWQIFLESVGGAAIITVFGGGIIGALLTSFLQRGAKKREILLNQLDADKQRRLQREQVYLDGQLKVATEILEMVTEVRSKSENLVHLTTTRFSPKSNPTTELKDYRNQVRSDFNQLTHTWRSRREILSALLGTYHKQDRRIFRGWIGLQKATTALMEKSESIYNIYYDNGQVSRPEEVVEKDYAAELDAIEKAMHEFSEALYYFRSQFNSDMDRFESAQTSPA